jgi:hypothetical protein
MLDTEELGKELDSLLNHIRTTRNNTTYGLFDKKYKYTKSYSYGNPNEKEDFTSSSSFSRRMNSISGTQDYTPGGYSSLNTTDNNNNNNPYYSQSYLSSSDKNSKLDKFDSYNYTSSGNSIKFGTKSTTDSPLKYYDEPLNTSKSSNYTPEKSSKLNDDLFSSKNYNIDQSQAISLSNKSEALLQEHREWLKTFLEKNNKLMN